MAYKSGRMTHYPLLQRHSMVRRLIFVSVMMMGWGAAGVDVPVTARAVTLAHPAFASAPTRGSGIFVDTGQSLATAAIDVQMADFDGDGDVDLIFDSTEHGGEIWLNNSNTLTFTPMGQILGDFSVQAMAVGDIDGDGDTDVIVGNDTPNLDGIRVWKNNGNATFVATGQVIAAEGSSLGQVALGDVDGDEDLDLFVARVANQPNQIWLNNGAGQFADSGQSLGKGHSTDVALGDVDNDGDLDAFVVDSTHNTVWLNNGAGQFSDSGQQLRAATGTGVTLGDIDRDGDLDAATSNQESTNRLWQNDGDGHFTELPLPESGTNSQNVTFADVDVDGDLDLFVSRADLNLLFLNLGGAQMGTMGTYINTFQLLDTSYTYAAVLYDFDGDHDPDLITGEGITSRVWRNDGVSSLAVYYGIRDDVLAETERGQHYISLYYNHSPEIMMQTIKDPMLGVTAYDTLTMWKPNLETLLTDNRGDALITQAQVDSLDELLTRLSEVGSPALQQTIAEERAALPPFDTFVGQTMSDATLAILGVPTLTEQTYLPLLQHDNKSGESRNHTDRVPTMGCGCVINRLFLYITANLAGIPFPCR